jgi:hypothetical protein
MKQISLNVWHTARIHTILIYIRPTMQHDDLEMWYYYSENKSPNPSQPQNTAPLYLPQTLANYLFPLPFMQLQKLSIYPDTTHIGTNALSNLLPPSSSHSSKTLACTKLNYTPKQPICHQNINIFTYFNVNTAVCLAADVMWVNARGAQVCDHDNANFFHPR